VNTCASARAAQPISWRRIRHASITDILCALERTVSGCANSQIASAMSQLHARRTSSSNESSSFGLGRPVQAGSSLWASDQGPNQDERPTQPKPRRIGHRPGPPN
jgi:hypothetical protein